jgi:hypothetical protein
MTAAEKTVIGFATQTAKGSVQSDDSCFKYLLFREGGLSAANMNVPLDPEVGGGSMLRNIIRGGVVAGGALSIIPRPDTLGFFLNALLGKDTVTRDVDNTVYNHAFTHATDQFVTPWMTGRQAPGNMWGEIYPDMKVSSLVLSWRAARFVEGEVTVVGAGAPTKVDTMTTWCPQDAIDSGPQFIAPLGSITLPGGTAVSVTSGAFAAQTAMPIDEQMVVGSYTPQDLAIVMRTYVLSLVIKIDDGDLANKINLDPAGGNAWVAKMFRNANFGLTFRSPVSAGKPALKDEIPYSFTIKANGSSDLDAANVVWSARPLNFRAGRQIMMAVTGTFLADASPIEIDLTNCTPSY